MTTTKNKKKIKENKYEEAYQEAYQEEILIACQNGKSCSYGICDECPNVLGKDKEE